MNKTPFTTPILFVIFNRPDTTKIVFEEIRKLKPTNLFIAADGPRKDNLYDKEGCRLAREVVSNVDWLCEIKTLYREKNMGCKYAVSSAFDWFFDNVEEGIILEDDDLPDQSFFYFCRELLERYRNNPKIMHISGNNFQHKNKQFKCADSYYFSNISHIWGWATWRRAWKHYDVELKEWPVVKEKKILNRVFQNNAVTFMWAKTFQKYYDRKINSYDGQWVFACLFHNGLCINPSVNLVSNIGFGNNATHTNSSSNNEFANLPANKIDFPLIHPEKIEMNQIADGYTLKYLFNINRYSGQKIKWFLKFNFSRPYMLFKKIYYKVFFGKEIYDDKDLLSLLK